MFESLLILVLIGAAFSDRERAMYYYHKATGTPADVKAHIIAQIVRQMRAGGITLQDIDAALAQQTASAADERRSIMPRLFAILGGIFVLAGVGTYIGMFWEAMSPAAHVIMTLGLGLGLSFFAIVAIRENKYPRVVLPVLVAAAAACTTGGFVLLHEMFPSSNDPEKAMVLVFGAMALHQAFMFRFYPRAVTVAMGIGFLYAALGSACDLIDMPMRMAAIILGGSLMAVAQGLAKSRFSALAPICLLVSCAWFNAGIYEWVYDITESRDLALIITGGSVFMLGFALSRMAQSNLLGLLFLAGASMAMSGWFDLVEGTPYDLSFLLIAMGLVYVSILLKSRAVLAVATLSILAFVGYYGERYFADSIALPVMLILAGFLFIGISAGALRIMKKYF